MYFVFDRHFYVGFCLHKSLYISTDFGFKLYIYASLSSPPINEPTQRKLLLACTSECPFTHMDCKIYKQIDVMAMGSLLGVTFANYCICNLENKLFDINASLKPTVYCRYMDDCVVLFHSDEQLNLLVDAFRENLVVNLAIEQNGKGNLSFLDFTFSQHKGLGQNSSFKT